MRNSQTKLLDDVGQIRPRYMDGGFMKLLDSMAVQRHVRKESRVGQPKPLPTTKDSLRLDQVCSRESSAETLSSSS